MLVDGDVKMNKNKDNEELEKEIKELRQQLEDLKYKKGLESTRNKLSKALKDAEFRQKHKKLLGFTGKLEKNTVGLFKGFGKGLNKVAKGLEKSDEYIEKQKIKEKELSKTKDKPKKSEIKEEMEWLD